MNNEQTAPADAGAEHSRAYTPVEVVSARMIAEHYRKQVVVILAVDRPFDKVHVTTYGERPEDKVLAARYGDVMSDLFLKVTGLPEEKFEDFRQIDAARATRALELLGELVSALGRPNHPRVSELCDQAVSLLNETKRPPV